MPHFPFQGPGDAAAAPHPEEQWTAGTREKYVEMLEDMDASVGKVLAALQENDLLLNTIVVYASDHGAMKPGINTPLRDYKGTLFEGGIRVPCIVRWPGKLEAGSKSSQACSLMDLTSSFLRVAGAEVPDGGELDGMDILQHVEEGAEDEPRSLFWRARRGDRTWRAVRFGDAKYVRKTEGGETEEWLFDLAADESEEKNLLERNADIADELKRMLAEWELGVRAKR